jgi:hypothetical protein
MTESYTKNRKSNTQLICLSGLGGVQFLKGEHLKGEDETETMVSANFRITEEMEQIDLFREKLELKHYSKPS